MTGTLVNVAAIAVGSVIGVVAKKAIPQRINDSIIKAEGLGVFVIALNGIIAAMFRADTGTGKLSDSGGLLLLVSLVLGCLAGELLRLDDRINGLGQKLEARFDRQGDGSFAKAFVSGAVIFPIGAMSIIGSINDGLTGDSSVLFIKSLLDFTTSIVLASGLGIGVLFSALPVLLLQGTVTLLAGAISPVITDQLLAVFCMAGYTVVLAIGFNFITGSKIKVANLLPALAVPIIYHFLFA